VVKVHLKENLDNNYHPHKDNQEKDVEHNMINSKWITLIWLKELNIKIKQVKFKLVVEVENCNLVWLINKDKLKEEKKIWLKTENFTNNNYNGKMKVNKKTQIMNKALAFLNPTNRNKK